MNKEEQVIVPLDKYLKMKELAELNKKAVDEVVKEAIYGNMKVLDSLKKAIDIQAIQLYKQKEVIEKALSMAKENPNHKKLDLFFKYLSKHLHDRG